MDRKKITTINLFLIFLLIILAGIQVFLLNKFSTSGEKLTSVLKKIEEVEKRNSKLSQEIASLSAVISISSKAQTLGLNKTPPTLSLSSPIKVAKLSDFSF